MTGFWDASALVPVCVPWQGSARVRRLLREYGPVVWWGTPIEIAGALIRLQRQQLLNHAQRDATVRRLSMLRSAWREILPTERLRDLAEARLTHHQLRASDSLQLASALVWSNERPRNRAFLCADLQLADAARREGFTVISP